ncbi:18395_t:CDS:2, partial [Dentiscutata erythropus]
QRKISISVKTSSGREINLLQTFVISSNNSDSDIEKIEDSKPKNTLKKVKKRKHIKKRNRYDNKKNSDNEYYIVSDENNKIFDNKKPKIDEDIDNNIDKSIDDMEYKYNKTNFEEFELLLKQENFSTLYDLK